MCNKIILERKSTTQDIIDIGLYYLPHQKEFVTWQINKQFENTLDGGTINGHYFFDLRSAIKDFDERG